MQERGGIIDGEPSGGERKWSSDASYDIYIFLKHDANLKKSHPKGYILYDSCYMKYSE